MICIILSWPDFNNYLHTVCFSNVSPVNDYSYFLGVFYNSKLKIVITRRQFCDYNNISKWMMKIIKMKTFGNNTMCTFGTLVWFWTSCSCKEMQGSLTIFHLYLQIYWQNVYKFKYGSIWKNSSASVSVP